MQNQTINQWHQQQSKAEIVASAIVGATIFCGMLALMLAYFDVLTK